MPDAARPPRLNLALQGGGSHGAFTWGVLDALLEDGQLDIEGLSGTSAGAMNAVALAHGYAVAAQQKHANALAARQAAAQQARSSLRRLWEGVGALGNLAWGIPRAQGLTGMPLLAPWLAPAQLNPFDINPLRSLLEREIDFDLLRAAHPGVPAVFVCATNVRTGRGEIFSGASLSVDAVMASACLPLVFSAVPLGSELYWDGGYSGNPALHPLIYQTECSDILLVQINPIEHLGVPDTLPEIMDRMNEITFNASLLAELRAIEFVRRLLAQGKLDPRRYKDVRMHRIDGGTPLQDQGFASKARADLGFLLRLFDLGRSAAAQWLQAHRGDVGVRASLDLAQHA